MIKLEEIVENGIRYDRKYREIITIISRDLRKQWKNKKVKLRTGLPSAVRSGIYLKGFEMTGKINAEKQERDLFRTGEFDMILVKDKTFCLCARCER